MARKRDRKKVSAKRRLKEHRQGFVSTTIRPAEGIQSFDVQKAGVKRLDFLSYECGPYNKFGDQGDLHYECTYIVHYNIGAGNNRFICPSLTLPDSKRTSCPICEFRSQNQNDPDFEKIVKALAPSERQLWLLIDAAEQEKGIQLWDFSWWNFGKMVDDAIDDADEGDNYEFFADPDDGMTLKIGFVEEPNPFGGKPFFKARSVEFKERTAKYDYDKLLAQMPCLDELLIIKSYEELEAEFQQKPPEPSKDEPQRRTQESKKEVSDEQEVDTSKPDPEPEEEKKPDKPAEEAAPWDSEEPKKEDTAPAATESEGGSSSEWEDWGE